MERDIWIEPDLVAAAGVDRAWIGVVHRAGRDFLRYNVHEPSGHGGEVGQWAPWYDDSALQPLLYRTVHRLVLSQCAQVATSPGGCWTSAAAVASSCAWAFTNFHRPASSAWTYRLACCLSPPLLRRRHGRLQLAQGGVERLPFADARVRRGDCHADCRHWTDQAAGIAEIGRVLAPGGVFGLAAILPARRA